MKEIAPQLAERIGIGPQRSHLGFVWGPIFLCTLFLGPVCGRFLPMRLYHKAMGTREQAAACYLARQKGKLVKLELHTWYTGTEGRATKLNLCGGGILYGTTDLAARRPAAL